jgi:biopolymer transport protein ExbD
MRRRTRSREIAEDELNVTAFMNLMVALVPFLLMMAVFTRIAIVELSLPPEGASADKVAPPLQLEVIVRSDSIELADRGTGVLQRILNLETGYDLVRLSEGLQGLKARFPDIRNATILLEPTVTYEHLVNIMDTVREVPRRVGAGQPQTPLFPDIAVGDAPAAAPGGGSA